MGAFVDTENFEEKKFEEIWSWEQIFLEKVIYFFVVSLKMAVFKASLSFKVCYAIKRDAHPQA